MIIKNDKELLSYAYSVAGTVGLMMSSILKVKAEVAKKYAIDLGIAFQLTNIARDILEDAKMNRIYIPISWHRLNINEIKHINIQSKKKLRHATKKLLQLADVYYESAIFGLAFLNPRTRFAILLALIVYRQIGKKIILRNYSNLYTRERVSLFEKFLCLLKCIFLYIFNFKIHKKIHVHDKCLHKHIQSFLNKSNNNAISKF